MLGRGRGQVFGGGRGRTQPNFAEVDDHSESEHERSPPRSTSAPSGLPRHGLPSTSFDQPFSQAVRPPATDATSPAFKDPRVRGAFEEIDVSDHAALARLSAAGSPDRSFRTTSAIAPMQHLEDAYGNRTFSDGRLASSSTAPPQEYPGALETAASRHTSPPRRDTVIGSESLFDDFGFVRAQAPVARERDDGRLSPARSPRRRTRPLTVVDVAQSRPSVSPAKSRAPALRTATRAVERPMSPQLQRQQVNITTVLTGRQAQLESELERLRRALKQRDAEIETLKLENRTLRDNSRDAELRFTELVEKYRDCHQSLSTALGRLKQQQRDMERLQGALVGESTDNDVLRHGFTSLLRNAQEELTRLREEAAQRERAERYMRNA